MRLRSGILFSGKHITHASGLFNSVLLKNSGWKGRSSGGKTKRRM